jgi:hypothetical protein
MARNPTWSRDELILALDLYLRHRKRLPDSEDAEIVELSRTLNSLFGERANDAALFRNRNGVYMKLANFRAVDPCTLPRENAAFQGAEPESRSFGKNSRTMVMS